MKQRWSRAQSLTLSMLIAAGLINFLDRSSLSIALLPIRAELHLSATQIGGVLAAFSLAYAFAQLPCGPLLDRLGAWPVVGGGLALWSLAQILTAGVGSLRSFVPLRVLLGLGEAPFFPGAVKLVRQRFPAEHRGRAMGGVNISSALGQGLAPPLLTGLMLWLGWRSMFAAIGAAGALLAGLWFAVQHRTSPPSELAEQETPPITWQQWTSLFRLRRMWGMMLGFGGVNYTAWFYIAWLPAYLQQARGVTVLRSGWLAALPFLAGSAGMYASGMVSDARIRRGGAASGVHLSQIVGGMVVSALFTVTVAHVAGVPGAVACISCALFAIHFAGTSAWGYVHVVSDRAMVATVGSVQNFGSFVIASAAPFLTGWLLDRTHVFGAAFALCALVSLAGAGSYLLLVRSQKAIP